GRRVAIADGGADPLRRPPRVVALERCGRAVVGDLAKPSPARVERLEDAAHRAVRDPEQQRRAVRHPGIEIGAEVHVHEIAQPARAVELDAELVTNAAGRAVGGEQELRLDLVALAASAFGDLDHYSIVVRPTAAREPPGLVAEPELGHAARLGSLA